MLPSKPAFQLTWAGSSGAYMEGDEIIALTANPNLGFAFDELYVTPTCATKMVGGVVIALAKAELGAAANFIKRISDTPPVVAGVDAAGKYVASAPLDQLSRVVAGPPPSPGIWRFDFVVAPGNADLWKPVYAVDQTGVFVPSATDNGTCSTFASTPPPSAIDGEDWRWSGQNWVDVRISSKVLADTISLKVEALFAYYQQRFSAYKVPVLVGGSVHRYQCDDATVRNIAAINLAISVKPGAVPDPRPYSPSGEAPIPHTHDDFASIQVAGITAGDQHFVVYSTHKAAIKALTSAAAVQAYDYTTGWPV